MFSFMKHIFQATPPLRLAVTACVMAASTLITYNKACAQETVIIDPETGQVVMVPPATPPLPGQAGATADPVLAGKYYLRGVMETGSGLLLKPDGSFEWFLSVGALDIEAKGRWSSNAGAIILVNEPQIFQPQPYRFLPMRSWAEATEEEKNIAKGTAQLPCTYSDYEEPQIAASDADRAILLQIQFDPASLPLRNGAPRTKPYPVVPCTSLTLKTAKEPVTRLVYDQGHFNITLNEKDRATSAEIENDFYAGANVQNMTIPLNDLKPGIHPIWLDYRRFEPRMFDTLLLSREKEGLSPYFNGQPQDGLYVKVEPRKPATDTELSE